MKKMIVAAFLFSSVNISASMLADLDNPPGGSHSGQKIITGFASMGMPYGSLIDSEKSFIKGSIYSFDETETTRMVDLVFMSFNFGFSFEYMPVDHVGIKTRVRYDLIVQRTLFGSDYRNWNEVVFSGYSFTLGIPLHLTVRKSWDISFVPYAGYSTGKLYPAPVAGKLIDEYNGPSSIRLSGPVYGSELNFILFFDNGFVISFGIDWSYFSVTLDKQVEASYDADFGSKSYSSNRAQGFHTVNFILSAGYAFEY